MSPTLQAATTPWSPEKPQKPGAYLVRFIGDWFPDGDPNNIAYQIVSVVLDEGNLKVLGDGRFLSDEECHGWWWAKILC